MEELTSMGIISIIPALLAIALSFRTKNTIVALAVACITGTVLVGIHEGQGLVDILLLNFPTLLKENLGTTSFSWVMLLNTMIGILVAYFQKTGAIQGFSQWVHDKKLSRKGSQLIAWVLGMFVYFSDSFSPLFVGCTMRSITDKARISREKLAYIADSTSAPGQRARSDHRLGGLPERSGGRRRLHRNAGGRFRAVHQGNPVQLLRPVRGCVRRPYRVRHRQGLRPDEEGGEARHGDRQGPRGQRSAADRQGADQYGAVPRLQAARFPELPASGSRYHHGRHEHLCGVQVG